MSAKRCQPDLSGCLTCWSQGWLKSFCIYQRCFYCSAGNRMLQRSSSYTDEIVVNGQPCYAGVSSTGRRICLVVIFWPGACSTPVWFIFVCCEHPLQDSTTTENRIISLNVWANLNGLWFACRCLISCLSFCFPTFTGSLYSTMCSHL